MPPSTWSPAATPSATRPTSAGRSGKSGAVLRPGGTAAFLDFSKPPSRLGQAAGHFALKSWGGLWGLLLHGNPDVYGYIADSLRLYPDRAALRVLFAEQGFTLRGRRRFYGGLLENVVFEKKGA